MTTKGYKGFDENLRCRDFQYEIGKEYVHNGTTSLCHSGFHFVENPLDVFSYYDPTKRFAEVEAEGVSDQKDGDSKRVANKLKVTAELSLSALVGLGVKVILDKVNWKDDKVTNTGHYSASTNTDHYSASTNTGSCSASTNTGSYSASTNTGSCSASTNTGDRSASTNTGKQGYAASLGIEGKAKGAIGCWLTLAEWKQDKNGEWERIDIQTKKVDGKKIKADTFYSLVNGKFKEVK